MKGPWNYLKYLPPGLLTWIKHHSSARLRLWIRETFGGSYTAIPDTIVTVADGRRFHIGPDLIYWPIYSGVGHEPEATSVFRRLLKSGDVILDVGANFGWYTTLFAQLAPAGRVYAFEPVPETFGRLLETLALNGMSQKVTALQAAVSEAAGTCPIYTFERSSAYSSLSSSSSSLGGKNRSTVEVPKVSLDNYLSDQGLSRADFLKCDTEGAELRVLEGASKLLGSVGAPMIFIELNDHAFHAFGYTTDDVWRFLCGHGYDRFYEIVSARRLRRIGTLESFRPLVSALCAKGDVVAERLNGTDIEID